jgi:hypothetical protein
MGYALGYEGQRNTVTHPDEAAILALTDLDGRFLATIPVYQRMVGYSEQETPGAFFSRYHACVVLGAGEGATGREAATISSREAVPMQHRRRNSQSRIAVAHAAGRCDSRSGSRMSDQSTYIVSL